MIDGQIIAQLKSFSQNGKLILAFVTREYSEVALNWASAMNRLSIENYVIFCFDDESCERLESAGINVCQGSTLRIARSANWWKKLQYKLGLLTATELYTESDFSILWKTRFEIILELLRADLDIIHSDLDAVWLRNPLTSYLDPLKDYHIIGSIVEHEHAFPVEARQVFGFTICMGFVVFRAHPSTIKFLKTMYGRLGDDQEEFNKLMLESHVKNEKTDFGHLLETKDLKVAALKSGIVNRGGRIPDVYICHPNSPKLGESTKDILERENLWFL